MKGPDLSKLHDFYQPQSPSWMPQTIAWYVLVALILGIALVFAARALRRWMKNAYRRDAAQEIQHAPIAQLSEILKRTALVSGTRESVASLTGEDWTKFLVDSSGIGEFGSSPGNRIEAAALSGETLDSADEKRLRELAAYWVKKHHV